MSAEGKTNLDNDGAGDTLYFLAQNLFQRIEMLLAHPNGHHYDDGYISELFALIEVAFALEEKKILHFTPSAMEFCGRFDPFQRKWREYHRSSGHEPSTERARTMSETFERLEQICRSREEGENPSERKSASKFIPEEIEFEKQLFNIFENLQR